jgi:tRNA A-37 threonylcarbamoyl transferase component Bud32
MSQLIRNPAREQFISRFAVSVCAQTTRNDLVGTALAVGAYVRWCPACRAIYRAEFARCPVDGNALSVDASDPLIGTSLSHYVIDSFLGEGAMARVYRAHHALLEHKQFAVKVMIGDLAATLEMRLRFSQEADAASKLHHPNVVSVVDFGKTDTGLMFLAMELVEGTTLAQVIDSGGAMQPERALAIARQIALGLDHAHGRGLVHRDLKPDNVVVQNETVRIVDFGLAIPVDDQQSTRLTGVGIAIGTPIYASPEQTHNEPVDHRADLFALGVTLYEMLAGVPPYEGNTYELLHLNSLDAPPTILERSGVVVPPAVEAIALKLMRRDRTHRFASAAETIAAIDRAIVTKPRRRWPLALIGAVAVSAAALVALPKLMPAAAVSEFHVPTLPHTAVVKPPREPIVIAAKPVEKLVVITPVVVARRTSTPHVAPPRRIAVVSTNTVIPEPVATTAVEAPQPVVVEQPPVPILVPKPVASPPPPLFTTANVSVAGLRVHGSLATDDVTRALDHMMPAMKSCYGTAARAAQHSPATSVRISFSIDESRRASNIKAQSTTWTTLAACVATALEAFRVANSPDVGDVAVVLDLAFRPVSP